jgi:hypothetical protein
LEICKEENFEEKEKLNICRIVRIYEVYCIMTSEELDNFKIDYANKSIDYDTLLKKYNISYYTLLKTLDNYNIERRRKSVRYTVFELLYK